VLPDDNLTIAEVLKAAGYATIHLGKWHLSKDPRTQGFDINIGGNHAGGPYGGGYFSPFTDAMKPFSNMYPKGTHRADIFADQAIKFMNANKDKPFFMYMAYYSVHSRLQPVPEFVDKYKKIKGVNAAYASMIEKMDQSIGKITAEVDRLGLKEKTMILFTSDNGGVYQVSKQTPYRSGKGSYFEGGIREPMLVRWPGRVKAGTKCDVPVIGVDFYPTFLAAAGVAVPHGKLLDGMDLMPLLTQTGTLPKRALYWHFPIYLQGNNDSHDPLFRTRPGSAMRLGKWKLHEYFENGDIELYDLSKDVGERHNIAADMPEKTKELHAMMKAWRQKTKAPVPTKLNPGYRFKPAK
jgi:arylsulfatase A-like enzyme